MFINRKVEVCDGSELPKNLVQVLLVDIFRQALNHDLIKAKGS